MSMRSEPAPPVRALVEALRAALPPGPASLHAPVFSHQDLQNVQDCIQSTFVSSIGTWVQRFEQSLAERCGVAHAVAVVNGTAALEMSLRLAGVTTGDEVLMPALTFAGTANAVVHAGAAPHFVDCEATTLGLDPQALAAHLEHVAEIRGGRWYNRASGRRFGAIVPVHVFGHPVDLDPLMALAARYDLPVIEDAAEALGSCYRGRPAGSFGRANVLSFNGNKVITTGGGGAILTDDGALAERARHLMAQARLPHRWAYEHDVVGFNMRMPALNAALGCDQLERLDELLAAKRRLGDRYRAALAAVDGGALFEPPSFAQSNYWLHTLVLDDPSHRIAFLEAAHAAELFLRPVWRPLHQQAPFVGCPTAPLPVTEALAPRLISLPSGPTVCPW